MTVLARPELEASPLADLHSIANQVGLEGFRRLRKAELIDAILGETVSTAPPEDAEEEREGAETGQRARRRRPLRSRRSREDAGEAADAGESAEAADAVAARGGNGASEADADTATGARRGRSRRPRTGAGAADVSSRAGGRADGESDGPQDAGRIAAGVVEVLGNGSAFLRVDPPEPSDEDVYISAAQVRRCELVSGDRVTGPVRTPRRSERYPSLVRIDTINGASADTVSDGVRYDELPVDWPRERLALGAQDPTLEAIEWMTPIGHGSRVVIVGARHAGKSETLRRLLDAVHGRDELEVSLVLAGARPEEIAQAQEGPVAPAAALTFAASTDSQDQAVERAIDAAKRIAARGGNALVAIDSLDGLHPHAARKALAAARNLRDGGSLTVIAIAEKPLGGETTVIALDAALTSTGQQPILDLAASGTLKPELLVGDDGAQAITKARAAAV
ncbi:MAG: Rho termination factor N-terminal domain-containing protein [Solirubrobacteraceae bacterium]